MLTQLSVYVLSVSDQVATEILKRLDTNRFSATILKSARELLEMMVTSSYHPDCLVLLNDSELPGILQQLLNQSIFIPAVILQEATGKTTFDQQPIDDTDSLAQNLVKTPNKTIACLYHSAEVQLSLAEIGQLNESMDQAMAQFLKLPSAERLINQSVSKDPTTELTVQSALQRRQRQLAEKLHERLGYLGVYYKRNSQIFFRNLPPAEKRKLLEQLKASYCQILLDYFSQDESLNTKIDELVNLAFFADVSVTQIVEIHMGLIDEFSKQLKLEGRSEDILLDYRLTLIDVIAHLCEMYRRSIPRDA